MSDRRGEGIQRGFRIVSTSYVLPGLGMNGGYEQGCVNRVSGTVSGTVSGAVSGTGREVGSRREGSADIYQPGRPAISSPSHGVSI